MSILRAVLAAGAVLAFSAGSMAPAVAQQEISAQDRKWLMMAHQGNLAESVVGTMAQKKGKAKAVRSIGAVLVTDHSRLDRRVQATARRLGVSLPSEPSAKQKALAARLNAMSGKAFDRAWLDALIKEHRTDLAAARKEVRAGKAAEAQHLATVSTPVFRRHLNLLLRARHADPPRHVPAGNGGWTMAAPNERPLALGYGLLAAGMLVTVGGALLWRRPAPWRG
ncbi:hypothetical protein GCM10022214_33770 [Actinomadura miaoliensis]|uniref:DUF4142 domain-containing protein n=2 Tax=Actinomadura miaoliensis TaxID=430685 RepID=A0ABP7VUR9_9ACTN